jgi:hypothetical protein
MRISGFIINWKKILAKNGKNKLPTSFLFHFIYFFLENYDFGQSFGYQIFSG